MQIDCLKLFHSSTKDFITSDEILSMWFYCSGLSNQDWKKDFKPLMLWDIPVFQEQPSIILARVCFSFKNSCYFVGQFRLKRNSHYCPKLEFNSPSQKSSLSGPQPKLWLKINQKNMIFMWGTEWCDLWLWDAAGNEGIGVTTLLMLVSDCLLGPELPCELWQTM